MLQFFFYENKSYILLVVYMLVSLSFIIVKSPKANKTVKTVVNKINYPVQVTVDYFSKSVNGFWESINELNKIKRELVITKQQLEKLKTASIEINELKRENARLRFLLENKKKISYPTVYAEIIARDPSNYYYSFTINAGKNVGIKVNMPVITYQNGKKGIVGKTIEVYSETSKVLPLIGVGSYIGAMLSALRYTGVIKGIGARGDFLLLDYISRDAILNFGDEVITSGQGGIFPKGLLIGKVVGFKKVNYGLFYKKIKVKPIIDFSELEDVYVILKSPDSQIIKFQEKND